MVVCPRSGAWTTSISRAFQRFIESPNRSNHLFFAQFRTESRYTPFLELLWSGRPVPPVLRCSNDIAMSPAAELAELMNSTIHKIRAARLRRGVGLSRGSAQFPGIALEGFR
ncbi:MAG: hypothetical protein E5X49_33400 [Mesorhizobium sp.]|nr:MAG: hypothetical protein EOQ28_34105 [Mesorhizobium sp.]RWB92874.1 MAG: hypothetical protein EOQ57_35565 [Mesorhizobium sp.]RWG76096.1 MAG: hypothetical protein EOQ69_32590 [Mesorhizobium sp.]RWG76778.1 MAG: hypothetical protein EOQ70_33085 [Mesorhizobium sp.]RWJ94138.1 MAG: hypothetical protein EOR42_31575 [Mesorhizobium sp.]